MLIQKFLCYPACVLRIIALLKPPLWFKLLPCTTKEMLLKNLNVVGTVHDPLEEMARIGPLMLKAPQIMILWFFSKFSWALLGRSFTNDISFFWTADIMFHKRRPFCSSRHHYVAMPICKRVSFCFWVNTDVTRGKWTCNQIEQEGAALFIGIHAGLYPLAVSPQSLLLLPRYFFESIDRSLNCLRGWSYKVDHCRPNAPHFRALGSCLYYSIK